MLGSDRNHSSPKPAAATTKPLCTALRSLINQLPAGFLPTQTGGDARTTPSREGWRRSCRSRWCTVSDRGGGPRRPSSSSPCSPRCSSSARRRCSSCCSTSSSRQRSSATSSARNRRTPPTRPSPSPPRCSTRPGDSASAPRSSTSPSSPLRAPSSSSARTRRSGAARPTCGWPWPAASAPSATSSPRPSPCSASPAASSCRARDSSSPSKPCSSCRSRSPPRTSPWRTAQAAASDDACSSTESTSKR